MAIRYLKRSAALEGHVGADDAEALLQWLQAHPKAGLNLSRCDHVHASVLQVLLALRPPITAAPPERWLAAALH